MSVTDVAPMLDDFGRRLYSLEQSMYGSVQNEFSEIIVDDGTNPPVIITPQPPGIPTGLTVTPGSFYDVIYADIEWTPAVGGEPAYVYEIEVAKKVSGVYQTAFVERTAGTNFRIQPLEPNTTYGVRVTAYSILGVNDDPTAWVDFDSGIDTSIPDAPTAVQIARGATSVIVTFTGSNAVDVADGKGLYLIEIDTSLAFDTGNKRTVRTTGTIFAFSDITAEGTWYARVAAIDTSGNQSAWATSTGYTAGAIIDNMIVAGLDAAKITFGTMSGDRITANTLDVTTIKTSTLTSAEITVNGGSIKIGDPPTTGVLINSQGIRLYNAGALKVILDAATGNATFRGNIDSSSISSTSITASTISGTDITGGTITSAVFRTATSGRRVEIDSASWADRVRFFTNYVSETGPGVLYSHASTPGVVLQSPVTAGGSCFISLTAAYSTLPNQINMSATSISATAGSITLAAARVYNSDYSQAASGFAIGASGSAGTTVINSSRAIVNITGITSTGNITTTGYISLNGGWVNLFPDGQIDNQGIHLFRTGAICVESDGWINTAMPSTSSAANVNVTFGTLQLVTSSEVGKTRIKDLHEEMSINVLHGFRPRSWRSRWHEDDLGGFDDPNEQHFGFVAEELEAVDRRLVTYPMGEDSHIKGINWNAITALLVSEVQKLRKQVDELLAA